MINLQIEQVVELTEINLPDFTLPKDNEPNSTKTATNQEGFRDDENEPSAEIVFCLTEASMTKWRYGRELTLVWWP